MRNAVGIRVTVAPSAWARAACCGLALVASCAVMGLGAAGCVGPVSSISGSGGGAGGPGSGGAVVGPGPDAAAAGTGGTAAAGGTTGADAATEAPRPDGGTGGVAGADARADGTVPATDAAGSGGARGTGGASGTGGAPAPDGGIANGVPGIVGVGYGGIRIVSRDLGRTWSNETHWAASGGDDNDLLRSIAYGNGLWVAGGWRYVTSTDGVTWTDRGKAIDVIKAVRCDITDSMAFGNGRFLVACGSNLAYSTDGLGWTKIGAAPDVMGHQTLVFDPGTGRFAISGDNDRSFVSSDSGQTWTPLDGVGHVRLCKGALRAESECPTFFASDAGNSVVFLGVTWAGIIRRSTDGSKFSNVYDDPASNTLFTDYALATGIVAPR